MDTKLVAFPEPVEWYTAKCDFIAKTLSLVSDNFNLNNHNKAVQKILCHELKVSNDEVHIFDSELDERIKRYAL